MAALPLLVLLACLAVAANAQPGLLQGADVPSSPGKSADVENARALLKGDNAKLVTPVPPGANVVDREFLVEIAADADAAAVLATLTSHVTKAGGLVKAQHKAPTGWKGLALQAPRGNGNGNGNADKTAALLQQIVDTPGVLRVEANQFATAIDVQTGSSLPSGAWGLDRIDDVNAALPQLDGSYGYSTAGGGTCFYGVDTGIRSSHVDFSGRILAGYSAYRVRNRISSEDNNGHGTHTAGTAAGTTYGVAKKAIVIPVKVLNSQGSGTYDVIISGINTVATDTQCPHAVNRRVINLSLGGGYSGAVNSAVASAVASGVTVAVAAGNSNADACGTSPASAATALTVGATDRGDGRASFSNYGSCLDLWAPGVNILSAWYSSNSATSTLSGTSMAAPHVAGLALRCLSPTTPSTSPAALPACDSPARVEEYLKSNAVKGVVTGAIGAAPNQLAALPATV